MVRISMDTILRANAATISGYKRRGYDTEMNFSHQDLLQMMERWRKSEARKRLMELGRKEK